MGLVQPLSDPLQQFDFLLYFRHDAPRSLVCHNHFEMHVAEAVAAFHGGTAQVQFTPAARYPVVNDEKMTAIGREAAEAVGFKHFDMPNSSASDNFAEFLHAFPGYYCFVGSQPSRPGTSGNHHAPDFDLDESVLPRISFMFLATAKRLESM